MNIYVYKLKVKHDTGIINIITSATSEYNAKYKVMLSENCPLSAIIDIRKIKE